MKSLPQLPFTFIVPPDVAGELCWRDACLAQERNTAEAAERWALLRDRDPSEFNPSPPPRRLPLPKRFVLFRAALGHASNVRVFMRDEFDDVNVEGGGLVQFIFTRALVAAVRQGFRLEEARLAFGPRQTLVQPFGTIHTPALAVAIDNFGGHAGLISYHAGEQWPFLAGCSWKHAAPNPKTT